MPRTALLIFAMSSMLLLSGCMPWAGKDLSTRDLNRHAIETPSGRVSFITGGDPDAPRIIYIHGTPGSAASFAPYIREPIPGTGSIAIDRPGFGASDPTPRASFAIQAAAIEPFLVERRGRWPILVGHSLGGPIIARIAGEHPDRVAGLVIIGGSLDPELEEWKWYNTASEALGGLMPRDVRNANTELRTAEKEMRELAQLLASITCPVTIIHGDRDKLVPIENVDYMLTHFTNAEGVEAIILDGEGHFPIWSHEQLVREQIELLLRD